MRIALKRILPVVIPSFLAAVVCWGIQRIEVIPWIYPDSFSYLEAARGNFAVKGFHSPVFGWLMLLTARWGFVPIVMLQMALWIGCVAMIAHTLLRRRMGATRAIAGGVLFIAIEVYVAHTLPMTTRVLTDALCATLTLTGILLLFCDTSPRAMLTGAVMLGTGNTMRPVMAGIIAGSAAVAVLYRLGIIRRRMVTTLIGVLWVPTIILCTATFITYGTFAPSSQLGFFALGQAVRLAEPDDRVFDSPDLNRVFHEALRTLRPPTGHAGWDPYLLEGNKDYIAEHALSSFYASLIPPGNRADVLRFSVGDISVGITRKLIVLHPVKFLRIVTRQAIFFALPDRSIREDFLILRPRELAEKIGGLYANMHDITQYRARPLRDHILESSATAASILDTESYGMRLPEKAGALSFALSSLLLALIMTVGLRGIRCSGTERLLGWTVLTLLLNSVLQTGIMATVTVLGDSRYRLPGLLTSEAAVVIALTTLWSACPRRPDLVESSSR